MTDLIKDINYMPTLDEISNYTGISLFNELCRHMDDTYKAICKIEYSKDVYAQGWNVKFRKSGKSLCVIYPKKDYLTVLVVVSSKEKETVERILPSLSVELQNLYHSTKEGNGQRWLMIDVYSHDSVYEDILKLIQIRRQTSLKPAVKS